MSSSSIIHILNEVITFNKHHQIDRESFLWEVTYKVVEELRLEDFVIYLPHDSNHLIQITALGHDGTRLKDRPGEPLIIGKGEGVVGACAKSKTCINIKDTTKDSRYIVDGIFRYSELSVPILWNNQTIGVIDTESSELEFYSGELICFMNILSSLLSLQLQKYTASSQRQFKDDNLHYKAFTTLIVSEKLYLDESISQSKIAEQLGISSSYLSQIVNKVGNHTYTEFINQQRIAYVIRSIQNGKHRSDNLLSIGLSAGFNSKSSFNLNFKKITGKSPSDYISEAGLSF